MTKKTFIMAVAIISVIAIGLTLFVVFFQFGDEEKIGSGEKYEITAEDRVSADSVLRDFVNRTGNFGLNIPEDADDDAIGHTVYDFALAIESLDFSYLFLSRPEATKLSSELISSSSDVFPTFSSEKPDLSTDIDVFGYRTYKSTVQNIDMSRDGVFQSINNEENFPSMIVELELNSSIQDRKIATTVPEGEQAPHGQINDAAGWTITERSKDISQKFTVQLIKEKDGWVVYRVNKPTYPEVLSVFPTTKPDHEMLMTGSDSKNYEIKFDEEHSHEH